MPACIACGESTFVPQWEILSRCTHCGFIRAAESLTKEAAASLYGADYFQGQEYGDYLADRQVHLRNFAARFRQMQRIAGPITSIFEIGCAYGLWLKFASAQGVRAAGIDVCQDAVSYAREKLGQQAECGDFLEMDFTPGDYQSFCLWDTVEHLPHPEHFVSRASELLPPGGWLFLTTGDIGSRMARFRGRKWRMIHPPTHLQYFSRDTMRRFLARHGLVVAAIRSTPMYRTMHSVLAGLSALGKGWSRVAARSLARTLPALWQHRVGAWIDLGDIMFVAAQKPRPSSAALVADVMKP